MMGELTHSFAVGGQGNVTFDNFVQACVNVKTLTDSFRSFDTDNDGWIQINYEQVTSPLKCIMQ
jgi:Ca2+-binding EF-hand superfamily protein